MFYVTFDEECNLIVRAFIAHHSVVAPFGVLVDRVGVSIHWDQATSWLPHAQRSMARGGGKNKQAVQSVMVERPPPPPPPPHNEEVGVPASLLPQTHSMPTPVSGAFSGSEQPAGRTDLCLARAAVLLVPSVCSPRDREVAGLVGIAGR